MPIDPRKQDNDSRWEKVDLSTWEGDSPGLRPKSRQKPDAGRWEKVDLSTYGRAKEPEKKEGTFRGLARDVGGGLADLGEMYGRGIRAMPGGAEAGKGKGVGGGIITSAKGIREQYDLDPKERTGISRWIHGGIRAATTSLAAGAPGALAGIAATSWIPIPGARLVGGIVGYAVGGATLFGVAEYDSTLEEALKANVDPEKAEAAAIRNGLFEGGFEFGADILEGVTMGAGRVVTAPAKVALKDGIKSMFKVGAKQAIKRGAGVAAIETGSEMLTAGLQTEEYYKLGLTKQRFYDAAAEAFGPAFVASLIFGGMAEGGLQLNRRRLEKVLKDPDAKPEERMAVVSEVYEKILPVDKEMAEQWKESAAAAVNNNEAIPTDEALESDKELEGAVGDREAAAEKLQEQAPPEKAKAPSTARETLLDETEQTVTAKELLTGKKETLAAEEFVGDESIEAEEAAAAFTEETLEKTVAEKPEKKKVPVEFVGMQERVGKPSFPIVTELDEGKSTVTYDPKKHEITVKKAEYEKAVAPKKPEGPVPTIKAEVAPEVSPEGAPEVAEKITPEVRPEKPAKVKPAEEKAEVVKPEAKKGDVQGIMDTEAVVSDIQKIDGVTYELYSAKDEKDKSGFVRVYDAESGEVVSLKKYPAFEQAKKEHEKVVSTLSKPQPSKPYAETKKAAVPKKAKIKSEEPAAPEKVEIPTFTNTTQATTFGKKATPEQITELKKLRKEAEARYYVLAEEGKQDEADKEALKTQLYREAFEAKEKVEKEVVPEKIEEKKSYKMTLAEIHKKPDILMSLELKQLHEHKARTLGFEKAGRSFTEGYLKKLAEVAGKTDMPAVMTVSEALSAYKKGDITQASLAAEKILGKLHKAEKEALTSDKISEMHKKDIQQALKEGKPVQKEVLAEYPDLAPAKPAISKPAEAKPSEALKEEIEGEGIVEGALKVEKAKAETTLEKKEAEKVSGFEGTVEPAPTTYGKLQPQQKVAFDNASPVLDLKEAETGWGFVEDVNLQGQPTGTYGIINKGTGDVRYFTSKNSTIEKENLRARAKAQDYAIENRTITKLKKETKADEKKPTKKVSELEGIDLSKITVEVESIRAKTGEIVKVTKNAETAMKEIDSDIEKMYAVLNCL